MPTSLTTWNLEWAGVKEAPFTPGLIYGSDKNGGYLRFSTGKTIRLTKKEADAYETVLFAQRANGRLGA